MNREIEFRGYHTFKDYSEWVYGHYFTDKYKTSHHIYLIDGNGSRVVDKESVGQYTNLNDKNGNKIYEGDIIKFTDTFWDDNTRHSHKCTYKSVVVYEHDCFVISSNQENNMGLWSMNDVCEVIGNIYQNSNLITNK